MYRTVVQAGHADRVRDFIADDYIQHNPNAASGAAALEELVSNSRPQREIEPTISLPLVSIMAERNMVTFVFVRREEGEGSGFTGAEGFNQPGKKSAIVAASRQCQPRKRANRRIGIGARKAGTLCRQQVKLGHGDMEGIVAAKVGKSHVVSQDQEDIGPSAFPSPLRPRPQRRSGNDSCSPHRAKDVAT